MENAAEHLNRLAQAQDAFFDSQPFLMDEILSPDGKELALRFTVREPPPRIGAIAGDVVHNLRSGLNLLFLDLLKSSKIQIGPNAPEFPIIKEPQKSPTFRGLPEEKREWLDSLQPRHLTSPAEHPLTHLQALTNADKHFDITVRGSEIQFKFSGPPPSELEIHKVNDEVFLIVPAEEKSAFTPQDLVSSIAFFGPEMPHGINIQKFVEMANFVIQHVFLAAYRFFPEEEVPKIGRFQAGPSLTRPPDS